MPKNLLRLLATVSVLAACAGTPLFAKTSPSDKDAATADSGDTYKQLTLFSDVMERVHADYVDPVTDEKLVENALNGMLSSLDPHSSYMDKKEFADMTTTTKGEFGGLGIEVTMENGIVKVISPIDDTPAAKAGVKPGDLITFIDGKPVTDYTLNEAVDHMRGVPGSKVTLSIRRGGVSGRAIEVSLTRAIIKVQSVKWEPKGDIAYIRITVFNEQTQAGLDKAMKEADAKIGGKLIGYVIDLRNNPGGLLDQAISVASTFLDSGKDVVSTRGRHKEDDQSFAAKGGDQAHEKPIAVLINGGSASASEIVAGALQDDKRAILVGTRSFGKGSVQTIIPVEGGGAMRLTTARYYTPSGRSIQALGIEPDITVQQAKLEKVATLFNVHEADLKGALINETVKVEKTKQDVKDSGGKDGKDKATPTTIPDDSSGDQGNAGQMDEDGLPPMDSARKDGDTSELKKDEPPFDYQLARALDLLRGVNIFEGRDHAAASAEPAGADATAVGSAASPTPAAANPPPTAPAPARRNKK